MLRTFAAVMPAIWASCSCSQPWAVRIARMLSPIALQRDDFSVYTEDEEDEVRELLADKGFISESIDEIIVKMEMNEWFSEEEEE